MTAVGIGVGAKSKNILPPSKVHVALVHNFIVCFRPETWEEKAWYMYTLKTHTELMHFASTLLSGAHKMYSNTDMVVSLLAIVVKGMSPACTHVYTKQIMFILVT